MEPKPLKATELSPPLNVTKITDAAGLAKLADFFSRCDPTIGWDVETDPRKDYFWRRLRTCQFGNQQEQYVVDLLALCGGDSDLLFKGQGHYGLHLPDCLQPFIDVVKPVVCSKDFLKVGVNLGFEAMTFYWCLGLRPWNFFDCSMVEKCIWAGAHSMKDYGFYSMEEMMLRYFQVQIDKSLQESFNLTDRLTDDQFAYAALDTRFPLALRQVQLMILEGETYESLKRKGHKAAAIFKNIEPLVTGDNLLEIAQIENDAISAFQEMHVHGERLDRERWIERIAKRRATLKAVIHEKLDPVFIPIVGSKSDTVTDEEIAVAEAKWKSYNTISDAELELKTQLRVAKKQNPGAIPGLELQRQALEEARKMEKEHYKTICSDLKKKRTQIKNLAAKCEGEALINYGSRTQLLEIFHGMKGLTTLKDTEDETLEKFEHIPVIAALREYRTLSKEIKTYGEQWVTEWKTKPGKKEGWLHPGDGRLHCVFNQYDAETGRSTSEQPNAQNLPRDKDVRACFIADPPDADEPEGYVIVTADMSGAELRILADLADDPVWIGAFNRDEDVHSICAELIEGEELWRSFACKGGEVITDQSGKEVVLPPCAYYELKADGTPKRKKCKCPKHNEIRDGMKPTNFGIPYGISPQALHIQIKKTLEATKELMDKHKAKFPRIWAYVAQSGKNAQMKKKSFDMYGRRRLFPDPTWDRAKQKAMDDREEKLEFPEEEQERNKANFLAVQGRKPNKDELWLLTHRLPNQREIANAYAAMHGSIERQGKNHEIQGTNATIAKKAMGCGFSPDGKPYLWHTLPQYKAKLLKFVHDELVIQCPKRFGKQVAELIGDAFKRAAAEKMKKVSMEFEYNIAAYWKK